MFSIIPYRSNRAMAQRPTRGFFDDDFFRPFFEEGFGGLMRPERAMKVDVRDEGDHYLLEADIPGVAKDDVKVEVEGGVLTIAAEYNQENEEKNDENHYVYRERHCGSMRRAFNVEGIREDDITAEFRDGVLRLTLPKQAEEPKPAARAIEIQ